MTTTGIGSSTPGPARARRRLEAVDHRHPDVEEAHVGPDAAGERHRLGAVGGLADDLDVGLRVEDHAEPGAHELLVVGDEHAHGHVDQPDAREHGGRRPTRRPAAGPGLAGAAEQGRALGHPGDAVAGRRGCRGLAVVAHLEPHAAAVDVARARRRGWRRARAAGRSSRPPARAGRPPRRPSAARASTSPSTRTSTTGPPASVPSRAAAGRRGRGSAPARRHRRWRSTRTIERISSSVRDASPSMTRSTSAAASGSVRRDRACPPAPGSRSPTRGGRRCRAGRGRAARVRAACTRSSSRARAAARHRNATPSVLVVTTTAMPPMTSPTWSGRARTTGRCRRAGSRRRPASRGRSPTASPRTRGAGSRPS